MDAQLKAKWVEALRSEKFNQGIGLLHRSSDNTHCCLGVLCAVSGRQYSYFEVTKLGVSKQTENALIDMNDGVNETPQGSFAQIADYIEREL